MGKKWLRILLLLLTGLGVAGCGQSRGTLPASGEDTAENRLITVGFSQLGSESDWRIANSESFVNTFTRENGYDLLLENAQQKQENQLKAIRKFCAPGCGLHCGGSYCGDRMGILCFRKQKMRVYR